jgi:ecotin
MRSFRLPLRVLACSLPLVACAVTPGALDHFPPAASGQTRHVIELPPLANEQDFQVEVFAGKTLSVDCNSVQLGGQWQTISLQAGGRRFYELDHIGPAISTKMGCPNHQRELAFVPVQGKLVVRYNSKFPLVVYVPSDAQLRHRIRPVQ